jgi:hypothetical protein
MSIVPWLGILCQQNGEARTWALFHDWEYFVNTMEKLRHEHCSMAGNTLSTEWRSSDMSIVPWLGIFCHCSQPFAVQTTCQTIYGKFCIIFQRWLSLYNSFCIVLLLHGCPWTIPKTTTSFPSLTTSLLFPTHHHSFSLLTNIYLWRKVVCLFSFDQHLSMKESSLFVLFSNIYLWRKVVCLFCFPTSIYEGR